MAIEPERFYQPDLAYIHDLGFGDFALKSTPGILEILRNNNISDSLVVELGCGSGLSARKLINAGYRVWGIDLSQAMVALARKRVPEAKFYVGSLFQVDLPACQAVLSIGECLNYLFDENNNLQTLVELFARIYQALKTGGVFIFDVLEPKSDNSTTTQSFKRLFQNSRGRH